MGWLSGAVPEGVGEERVVKGEAVLGAEAGVWTVALGLSKGPPQKQGGAHRSEPAIWKAREVSRDRGEGGTIDRGGDLGGQAPPVHKIVEQKAPGPGL